MHAFEDIPADLIETGKFGAPLVWEAEPGDAIAFHGRTIHGAPGNNCMQRHRRVLSLRWLGEVNRKHKAQMKFISLFKSILFWLITYTLKVHLNKLLGRGNGSSSLETIATNSSSCWSSSRG